ncbi:TRAP transporter small permease [Pusillimonas sp. CC-YST705]|uniref:TRAP transporter small permease protein n=1 Tax=Mesopusillimonas faecipullorum TaxID=2755040 RepID=A0ABS8CE72_9BURK|nr:TRAP transporter small permease [Mesopusillimonas faecipullorum]MCB5364127.1 TRAP transporter small permease [Mesopusillimonas faecipullorum]
MEPLPQQETESAQRPKTPAARAYYCLVTACGVVAAVLFGLMALLVCLDVVMRNLSNHSIPWSVEMTEYMLMVAAFLAAPWLAYTNDHIRVDVLVRGLPPCGRKAADVIGNLICLVISLILAYESIKSLISNAEQGSMVFKVLIFPEWWLAIPITISFILLSVEFIRRLFVSSPTAEGAA